MKKEIKIVVPNDWSAVSLEQYLALRKDMEIYKDEPEAIDAVLFHHLCKLPLEYLQQLDVDTYISIKKDLAGFFSKAEGALRRFITIDGEEYGFEPNLSQMAYGAYVDISKYETLEINDKWAEIMSILYRPVTSKKGALYDIKPYDGVLYPEKFKNVGMDVHFGTLFFLINLLSDLQKDILKSLKGEYPEIPYRLKSILLKSGETTLPFSNWLEGVSSK
jgi:hypothetical protein